jgi:dTDP-4-dehydrorhamnose reductase
MSPLNYLIIGVDGMLGAGLASHLIQSGHTVYSTHFMQDRTYAASTCLDLNEDVSGWQPPVPLDAAFLCAAVTSIDQCHTQPEKSRRINVENTLSLAEKISKNGAALFFPSSNLVFDGCTPFQKTTDKVNPCCEYGKQKAETEQGLKNLTNRVSIVRFTKILSSGMALIRNWIDDLRLGKAIHPFSDMVLSPVSIRFAVEAAIAIMQSERYGIWQVSATEDVTYEQMARYLARKIGASETLIEPVKSAESGLSFETIPMYTTLDTSRLQDELGLRPPSIWESLDNAISNL